MGRRRKEEWWWWEVGVVVDGAQRGLLKARQKTPLVVGGG